MLNGFVVLGQEAKSFALLASKELAVALRQLDSKKEEANGIKIASVIHPMQKMVFFRVLCDGCS